MTKRQLRRGSLKGFARDCDGASAEEFALVSVPFIALILFTIQAFIVFFAESALETFAETTARALMTGTTQKAALSAATFQSQICVNLPAIFNCKRLWVGVANATDFTGAVVTTPTVGTDGSGNVTTPWTYAPGSQGNVVVVQMAYMWPVVGMPLGTLQTIATNVDAIYATTVLKTEAYQ